VDVADSSQMRQAEKMAAMSSGKKDRPSKPVKGGTSSTRKYRFQSFNQRISKLSIDPIRRSRAVDLNHTDLSSTNSFFKEVLDRWKDTNLSENFTSFVREVQPLCGSLPQLIHHQQCVMSIIVRYVEKRDSLSLEPLLDLLANFAHDLGARFESHFGAAVTLVASLAATHSAVEVIEWSFNCLTWLFKYLSRLLVPDLRPLFHIMAPLLGKEPQRAHITQFAAEALSYLIRRAAKSYHKNQKPLNIVVQHVLDDLGSMEALTETVELYQHGLMALFVDSIKGVERKLYSPGDQIYQTLVEHVLEATEIQQRRGAELICGVTTGLLHFTDAQGFQPISEIIVNTVAKLNTGSRDASVAICGRWIFVAATVRKGSRITDWNPLLKALISLLRLCDIASNETYTQIYRAAAVILQTSPLEVVLPYVRPAMHVLAQERHSQHFLTFCYDFHDLGAERFHSLLFPYLSK
jgi:U3 small nucleolar RNA-associated protein 20